MVFKLGNILSQAKNQSAQNEAAKRPFDVRSQLAAIATSQNASSPYSEQIRQKRLQVLEKITLPASTLQTWIQEEVQFLQQQQQQRTCSLSCSLDLLTVCSEMLVGSNLGITVDTIILQLVSNFSSSMLPNDDINNKDQQDAEKDNDVDDDDDDHDDETAKNNDLKKGNNNNMSKENSKILSVAGDQLVNIFSQVRARNGNHFLENHKLFSTWRQCLEQNKATEDNGDDLDSAIRSSYKLQLLGGKNFATTTTSSQVNNNNTQNVSNRSIVVEYPCENIQEILQEYKEWELDETVKNEIVIEVATKFKFIEEIANLHHDHHVQEDSSSSSSWLAALMGKSENKLNGTIQFLHDLRTRKELSIVAATKEMKESIFVSSSEIEIVKLAIRSLTASWKEYSILIERKDKSDSINRNWFCRSLYVLMRGIQSFKEVIDEILHRNQQQNQSERTTMIINLLAQGCFELLQEMISFITSDFIQPDINHHNQHHKNNNANSSKLCPTFSIFDSLSKVAFWIIKHFELLYYYSRDNKVTGKHKDDGNSSPSSSSSAEWARKRLTIMNSLIKFYFYSPTMTHLNSSSLSRLTSQYIHFAVDDDDSKKKLFFAAKVSLLLYWNFFLTTTSQATNTSTILINCHSTEYFKTRPLEICEGAITGDESLEDRESALFLPLLHQCCHNISNLSLLNNYTSNNSNNHSASVNGDSMIRKHLITAEGYSLQKKMPLQSFVVALTAFSQCFRHTIVSKQTAVHLLNSLEKYRVWVLAVVATEQGDDHEHDDDARDEKANRDEKEQSEERAGSRRQRSENNNDDHRDVDNDGTKKFFVYQFPSERTEADIRAVLSLSSANSSGSAVANVKVNPIEIEFVKSSMNKGTKTVLIVLAEEDCIYGKGNNFPEWFYLLRNSFPGITCAEEKSKQEYQVVANGNNNSNANNKHKNNRKPRHENTAPTTQSENNNNLVVTNDDFAAMLG